MLQKHRGCTAVYYVTASKRSIKYKVKLNNKTKKDKTFKIITRPDRHYAKHMSLISVMVSIERE